MGIENNTPDVGPGVPPAAGSEARQVPKERNPIQHDFAIQDVSAWVLRIGVVLSTAVMVLGVIVSYVHKVPSVHHMKHFVFIDNIGVIWHGVLAMHGGAIIDVGVYMLVLTPIMRVFTSMILFVVAEKDYFYAVVTFFVLMMTLGALLFIH